MTAKERHRAIIIVITITLLQLLLLLPRQPLAFYPDTGQSEMMMMTMM